MDEIRHHRAHRGLDALLFLVGKLRAIPQEAALEPAHEEEFFFLIAHRSSSLLVHTHARIDQTVADIHQQRTDQGDDGIEHLNGEHQLKSRLFRPAQ